MQSKSKKRLKIVGIVILSAILIGLVFCAVYFSIYLGKMEKFDITKTNIDNEQISVMNFNVRCVALNDLGSKSWYERADELVSQIAQTAPDILTFQEVTKTHENYLKKTLIGYDYALTYRDKSIGSESAPIFYRTDKFSLVSKGSFWLSKTPEKPSKDWGAAFNRICSYVILTDISVGKRFVVFNTHLDHVSEEARVNGIDVVLDKIKEFGGFPSILTGDMNANEGSVTYNKATSAFLDSKYVATETMSSPTYHNWGKGLDAKSPIDYCFVSKDGIKVNSYQVQNYKYKGIYTSDHFPLVVKFRLI